MGTRYTITVTCDCDVIDRNVYYAPTCGFDTWECLECGKVVDLQKYTGISYEEASNIEEIKGVIKNIVLDNPPERIYLQYYDEDGSRLDSANNEVTWCIDRINDDDPMYILVVDDG